ncbi:hypothetical protein BaRGS_00017542, partial [Batillaria attramentaria]
YGAYSTAGEIARRIRYDIAKTTQQRAVPSDIKPSCRRKLNSCPAQERPAEKPSVGRFLAVLWKPLVTDSREIDRGISKI